MNAELGCELCTNPTGCLADFDEARTFLASKSDILIATLYSMRNSLSGMTIVLAFAQIGFDRTQQDLTARLRSRSCSLSDEEITDKLRSL